MITKKQRALLLKQLGRDGVHDIQAGPTDAFGAGVRCATLWQFGIVLGDSREAISLLRSLDACFHGLGVSIRPHDGVAGRLGLVEGSLSVLNWFGYLTPVFQEVVGRVGLTILMGRTWDINTQSMGKGEIVRRGRHFGWKRVVAR